MKQCRVWLPSCVLSAPARFIACWIILSYPSSLRAKSPKASPSRLQITLLNSALKRLVTISLSRVHIVSRVWE
uniref:Uncharacterized protein n=1 Tax=Mus musculus TaxID=10090 RepID=Q3U1Q8_MOUSE|nr:unnamed protein product [Mus musculus]